MKPKPGIVVVDDTPANLRLLLDILSDQSYAVRPVPDGRLALAAIQLELPDLILLDIMMPGMSGYEVCERLKADERTRDIPIIFISAKHEVLDKVKAFSFGAVDYITKPFQAEEVLARVKTHLALRTLQKQLEGQNQTLAETIQQLQSTQEQLIHQEKMAALGNLIAGIAHEINSPLGAIQASVTNISNALEHSFHDLPRLFQILSPERRTDFFSLLDTALANNESLSSKEQRTIRRELAGLLKNRDIPNAEDTARQLVHLATYKDIDSFLPLLREEQSRFILQTAYHVYLQKKNIGNISIAVERASKVLFALKNYAHYDESGEKIQAHITEGIDVVLTLYQNHLKHGIEVSTQYEEVPSIFCFPDELNQVWTNLIHNAIQAMHGHGHLDISVFQQKTDLVVEITDSGDGIPEDIQARIFEPFFTTKPPGEGSGLGLDIVSKILQRHQGRINVKSRPGNTTFTVLLPIHS